MFRPDVPSQRVAAEVRGGKGSFVAGLRHSRLLIKSRVLSTAPQSLRLTLMLPQDSIDRTSLVVQWLGIHLPIQETWV